MEFSFWHDKWERGDIGFHESDVNQFLESQISQFLLPQNARVFLPLCGKTRDIAWLLESGFQVAGIELVETAVQQLFEELNLTPKITHHGELIAYEGENVLIYVGDIFTLTAQQLGAIDLIYDRAAIVALPDDIRARYTPAIAELANGAPQLVVTFEYDQSILSGPPFSVDESMLKALYEPWYTVEKLVSKSVSQLKNKKDLNAHESAWHLKPV